MAKSTRTLGLRLLGAWLVLHALVDLFDLSFQFGGMGTGFFLALLALVTGVILIIG